MSCRGLRRLALHGCSFEDPSLKGLENLKRIEVMSLAMSEATNAVIPTLLKMPSIRKLYIHGTSIDDCGLQQLAALRSLRHISLSTDPITCLAIQDFRNRNKHVRIHATGKSCSGE